MEPEQEALYTVFFKDREANSVNKLNPNYIPTGFAFSRSLSHTSAHASLGIRLKHVRFVPLTEILTL